MTTNKHGLSAILTLGLLSLNTVSQAALVPYTADGVDLVYDEDRDLTWVANANLFKSQYGADNTTVAKIKSTVVSITGSSGIHYLVDSDFNTANGSMTWWGAMAWADWLNYGGVDDWRLWSALNQDLSLPCGGYNCTGSELGHVIYIEGGLTAGQSILADPPGVLDDYFINMQSYAYWSGQESPGANRAWDFATRISYQGNDVMSAEYFGWAVRPGRVAGVPLPATAWLITAGLAGLWTNRQCKSEDMGGGAWKSEPSIRALTPGNAGRAAVPGQVPAPSKNIAL